MNERFCKSLINTCDLSGVKELRILCISLDTSKFESNEKEEKSLNESDIKQTKDNIFRSIGNKFTNVKNLDIVDIRGAPDTVQFIDGMGPTLFKNDCKIKLCIPDSHGKQTNIVENIKLYNRLIDTIGTYLVYIINIACLIMLLICLICVLDILNRET